MDTATVTAHGADMLKEGEIYDLAVEMVTRNRGKLEIRPKVDISSLQELSVAYTPGVAEPCRRIAEDPRLQDVYTSRASFWAVVTDGSAVLGLGNVGPRAAQVVMEGKAALLKVFAGADAVPICLATQDSEEIIAAVKAIAPGFGGIFLEDIAAPRCFTIERRLADELSVPVFHDDQHGTAVAVCAGLGNALKLAHKSLSEVSIVISGAGASAQGTAHLLWAGGNRRLTLCDRHGPLTPLRRGLDPFKQLWAGRYTGAPVGTLKEALRGADVFIGLSAPALLDAAALKSMAPDPVIFALANPRPEIMPAGAQAAGARFIATGRFDYPNAVNNLLAFPGIVRGVMLAGAQRVTLDMKLAAAKAIADHVPPSELGPDRLLPDPLDPKLAHAVAAAVARAARPGSPPGTV